MGEVRAKALYDFTSAGPGELTLAAGEEVVVTRQDVGNGWYWKWNSGLLISSGCLKSNKHLITIHNFTRGFNTQHIIYRNRTI